MLKAVVALLLAAVFAASAAAAIRPPLVAPTVLMDGDQGVLLALVRAQCAKKMPLRVEVTQDTAIVGAKARGACTRREEYFVVVMSLGSTTLTAGPATACVTTRARTCTAVTIEVGTFDPSG